VVVRGGAARKLLQSGGLSTGAIAGIVGAAVGLIILGALFILVVCMVRKRRHSLGPAGGGKSARAAPVHNKAVAVSWRIVVFA
jgi:hypothetical protein